MPAAPAGLAAHDGVAYAWLKGDGELSAIDLASGKILRTFPGTVAPEAIKDGESLYVRVDGGVLLVGLREKLLCFELKSGEPAWEFVREGLHLLAPVLDLEKGRVFSILARPSDRFAFRGRWPVSKNVEGIIALDLKNGQPVWTCEELKSVKTAENTKRGGEKIRGVGQLIPTAGHLVFGSKAISGGSSPYLGSIDLATGKLVHSNDTPFETSYNSYGYNAILRDGSIYFAGAFTRVWKYDPASGEVEAVVNDSWNQRCTRFAATPRFLLFGQAAYYGEGYAGVQVSVGRSGCALPNTPANGMTYFTPTMCGCTTLVRGFQAMTGEALAALTEDSLRLLTGGSVFQPEKTTADLPAGPVTDDWLKASRSGKAELEAVPFGDLEIRTFPQQHRLEATRNGQPAWSFLAGARISSPPVVHGDVLVFGSHDGWVYAVEKTGTLRWRYLLAPTERLVGINSQHENTWPVYGVAVQDGKIIASAGTHVELDGGVTVAALDPATGKPAWIRHLKKAPSQVPPGGKGAKIISRSFLNSVPRVNGKLIELGDGGREGGEFSFDLATEEATINAELSSPKSDKQ